MGCFYISQNLFFIHFIKRVFADKYSLTKSICNHLNLIPPNPGEFLNKASLAVVCELVYDAGAPTGSNTSLGTFGRLSLANTANIRIKITFHYYKYWINLFSQFLGIYIMLEGQILKINCCTRLIVTTVETPPASAGRVVRSGGCATSEGNLLEISIGWEL